MRLTGTSPHMVIDYVLLYVHTMVTQEISIIVVYWGINRKKMGDMRSYSMLHSDISYDVTIFCWVNNTNDGKDSFVCFDNNFDLNKSLVLFDKTKNVAFLLVATAWCFRLRSQGPVGLREIISAMDGVYVDSCWFNGNIPWNLGLKNIGLIYDRYLQAIGSCCMAIDWLGVPNYGLKRLPLKSFWNVHLYCGLPTTRMFLGCLFFSRKQHQGESKFACGVGRPIFSVCSIIIVWCLWSDVFFP